MSTTLCAEFHNLQNNNSTIFKTFDSDVDKWTAKIGILGKSFNELGTAINDAFKSAIENIDNLDENVGFWKSLKNNLFSPENKDDFIRNSLGEIISQENINSYIDELDLESAKEKIKAIFDFSSDVENGDKIWQDYFDTLEDGEGYIIDLIKNTDDLSKLTGEDLVNANQNARDSAIAHNNALKQQTLSAKAGQIALKGLAIAGNMIAMWAISKVISIATEKITELANATEIAEEKASSFASTISNSISNISSHASTLEELNEEYHKLANGVNSLGENVSLSTDEYNRYKNVIQQLSDIMPNMATYFNYQGEKIAFAKGNLADLNDEYERYIQQQSMMYVANGDGDGNTIQDVLDDYSNNSNQNFFQRLKSTWKEMWGNNDIDDMPAEIMIQALEDIRNKSREEIIAYLEDYDISPDGKNLYTDKNKTKDIIWSLLGYSRADLLSSTDEEFNEIQRKISTNIESLQVGIASDMSKIHTTLIMSAYSKDAFWNIDDKDIRSDITTLLSSITNDVWRQLEIETDNDLQVFVSRIISYMSQNTDGFADAWNGLFALNIDEIPVDEYTQQVNSFIDTIATALGLNEDGKREFMLSLGFEDVNDINTRFHNSIRQITDDHGIVNRDEYSDLIDYTKEFTKAETELWLNATQGAENATDAINRYEEALESAKDTNETPDFFTQLNNSKESLDKFQSSVKSAYDAYGTLLSGNYSSNELLDSIQAINQAMSDIGSEIQWESMLGGGIGLGQVQEVLEREFQKYAESILRDVGIEIGSDFGQMLAHNIVNAQKASTQLEVLNDQIDSLQSAYSDLTDIVETFNDTGYITFDQLQKLLEMEPQYISCLVDENGQLQLNEQSMIALANQRLNDAEAQAVQQAITELGTLALHDEKVAVEQNAEAFSEAINDLADYNEELANTIAEATVGAAVIRDLDNAIRGAEADGATDDQINTVLTNLETKLQLIKNVRDQANKGLGGLGSVMKSGSSKSSSAKDFEETFDWIETAIDRIERSISNLDLKASSVYRSWSERNSNLKAELLDVKKEMDIQASGYNRYMQQANSVGLSEEWASKVRNGQIDINSITDKTLAERIKEYQDWYRNMPLYLVTGGGILFNC